MKLNDLETIGANIKYGREMKGWNQNELANRAKTRQATISQLENNAIENPSWDTLQRIADAYDVAVSELCDPKFSEGILTRSGLKELQRNPLKYLPEPEEPISNAELKTLYSIPVDLRPEELVKILREIRFHCKKKK